jgi:hypothetical protein
MTPHTNPQKGSPLENTLSRILEKLSDMDSSMDTVLDKVTSLDETVDAIYNTVSLNREPSYQRDDFLEPYD